MSSIPDRIRKVMKDRGINQFQLAALLEVGHATVSRWLGGSRSPGSEHFLKLAQVAMGGDGRWFLKQAGMTGADVDELSRRYSTSPAGVGLGLAVPVFAEPLDLLDMTAEPFFRLALPPDFSVGMERAACIEATDDLMLPLFGMGDLIGVERGVARAESRDCIVVAHHAEDGYSPAGIYVRWLRGHGADELLLTEQRGPGFLGESAPITITGHDPTWRILGRVIFWICKAPKQRV